MTIDEIAVDRVAAGHAPASSLNAAERQEVVRRLHAQRMSDGQIATRARMSARTVIRIRQRLGLEAVA